MRRNIPQVTEFISRPKYKGMPLTIDPTTATVTTLVRSGFGQTVASRDAEYRNDSTDFVGTQNRINQLSRVFRSSVVENSSPTEKVEPTPISE